MPFRSRTRYYPPYTGGYIYNSFTGVGGNSNFAMGYSTCADTVGDFPTPHALQITHRRHTQVGTVSGKQGTAAVYTYSDWPYVNQSPALAHWGLANMPSDASAVSTMMANTNPSRPEVSVPNFIFELKDIPSMIHSGFLPEMATSFSRRKKKRRGNSVVEINFGWALLLQDVKSMLQFTEHVNNRVKELNHVYMKGGLRKKRTVWTDTKVGIDSNVTFHSTEGTISGTVTWTTVGRKWVTCRWKPTGGYENIPSADEVLRQARFLVHGWDASPTGIAASMWNAFPWSWFADYFFNVGEFLEANRNTQTFTPGDVCVMTHTITTGQQTIVNCPAYFVAKPSTSILESKTRVVSGSGLSATQPFLTTKQLLTLSSIALSLGGH